MKIMHIVFYVVVILSCTSCQTIQSWSSTPTPLPGWNSYVADILIDPSSFPDGWAFDRNMPKGLFADPKINHVWRSWGQNNGGSGSAFQTVWRAYTIAKAKEHFRQLEQETFRFSPEARKDLLIAFEPPKNIRFESATANEYYLACGWYVAAYCELLARYRNYNMDFRIELEMDYQGQHSDGLSPEQIQILFNSADSKFSEYLTKINTINP
jgi:hypothetical protein